VSASPETVETSLAARRGRAEALRARHPFAEELLTLYVALLDAWEGVRELPADPGRSRASSARASTTRAS
jgi:hypothetical protein